MDLLFGVLDAVFLLDLPGFGFGLGVEPFPYLLPVYRGLSHPFLAQLVWHTFS
jgi:hypothetical protein